MGFRRVLFATDLSSASESAADAALELARALDADLVVLHVLERLALPDSVRMAAQSDVDRVTKGFIRAGLRARSVLCEGSAADEILATVQREGIEMVVMGTHGHRGVAHVLLGSVAERVVRLSPVPVLTVASRRHDS